MDHIQYAKSLVPVRFVTVSQGTLESHQTVDQSVRLVPSVPWILLVSIINVQILALGCADKGLCVMAAYECPGGRVGKPAIHIVFVRVQGARREQTG